jgi:putative chitinase
MSLEKLQEKIGLPPAQQDGAFGPTTLKAAAKFYKMTPERAAHFFGQTSHETGGFTILSENLQYTADGLKKIFPSYFPGNMADLYKMQPEKIASRVYGSRMGNGDEASRDGWNFRGRGALQLTGKDNYKAFSEYLHKPEILTNPDVVATEYAFESALFFFDKNKLWAICDQGVNEVSILALTKRINGGTNGLDDRRAKTLKYYEYLKA